MLQVHVLYVAVIVCVSLVLGFPCDPCVQYLRGAYLV